MKNALEEVTAKNAEKKFKTGVKHGRGGRHAPGQREGGEGHTSYDSLPKGAAGLCRIMQSIQHAAGPSAKGGGFQSLTAHAAHPLMTRSASVHSACWRAAVR